MSHFERGAIMRAPSAEVRAGGKGIDAARVGKSLKKRSPLLVLIGDLDGDQYCRFLAEEGFDFKTASYHGNIRVATMYREERSLTTTIVNEDGPTISQREWDVYLATIQNEMRPREIVASMGSFPHGVTEANLAELIALVHKNESLIFFDAAPHFLQWALRHGADIVSPNLDEAEAVIKGLSEDLFRGEDSNGRARAESAALSLCVLGAKIAIVHAGDLGSALAFAGQSIWVPIVDVVVASVVGAGDSLAAGFIIKSEEQGDVTQLDSINWELSLQYGTATASAACEMGRSGDVDPIRVQQLFDQLQALNETKVG
ncbi:MAG: PfkB family carbohydrate kinase [Actinomycetes bacterium]